MRPLIDAWRSATTRLLLIYGGLFALWSVALLGVVHWETGRYLNRVIDQILLQRLNYLANSDAQRLAATVDAASVIDPHGVMAVGLFDARGHRLAGNANALPPALVADGVVHALPDGVPRVDRAPGVHARGVSQRLTDGRVLVIAKDTSTVEGIDAIIRHALLWGLSLTLVPGVLGGVALARAPARRIRALQQATEPIRAGDLSQRLPVSGRGDELDVLAGIVNIMLGEIERLMGEVKGVCDNIAHDLRTPLTRLRAQLYRAQQQLGDGDGAPLLEACVADTDALLARFRALLRVSELEDRNRSACFKSIELEQVLRQVHEFYAPLAEDRGQRFALELSPLAPVRGDAQLLFEAFANLVGNAIKFTPAGGTLRLQAAMDRHGPRVEVIDSGPGIPPGEREAVTRRFYRGDNSRTMPGSGLGLSIVSAIVRLHGYALEIGETANGACIRMYCYAMDAGELPPRCLSRGAASEAPAAVTTPIGSSA